MDSGKDASRLRGMGLKHRPERKFYHSGPDIPVQKRNHRPGGIVFAGSREVAAKGALTMRTGVLWFCLVTMVLPGMVRAAYGADSAPAPIPAKIAQAKTVFLSNEGSDGGLFPHPFTGTESRAYNQLYAALRQWGRYDLVGDPAGADLVFAVQLLAPKGPQNADKTKGASDPLPQVRLVIYDRPTHYALWAITWPIEGANLQKTHDRNFDDAVDALVSELKSVAGQAPSAP
ncbi:hypothetical protein [Silvibacterium sp.]|uniref:hypothetical protein n=1 Tax=Silvibacterium sp. TaxID=1964179 RepID=UPI0039E3BF00